MDDRKATLQEIDYRHLFPWVHLFRAFRIALDPRKLILAGLALVALAAGETAFSRLPFWEAGDTAGRATLLRSRLGGSLALPWEGPVFDADRRADLPGAPLIETPAGTLGRIAFNWRVVLRPLLEPLRSVVALFEGDLSWERTAVGWTRLLWYLAVWALFGGAITQLAAVQFARDRSVGLRPALQFAASRYLSYLAAPLLGAGFVLFLWVLCLAGGWIGRIPAVGDGLLGLFWIVPLLVGLLMVLVLIGVVPGWPLMYATISTERSDAFDGFSRAYNYVYSRPWHYFWYAIVVLIYGSVVIYFVTVAGSLVARLAAWGISSARGAEETGALLQGVPEIFAEIQSRFSGSGAELSFGAIVAAVWMHLWALMIHGFVYSYFWTAATIMYFLLRQREDAVELDAVWIAEEQQPPASPPPVGVAASEQPVSERPAKAEDSSSPSEKPDEDLESGERGS